MSGRYVDRMISKSIPISSNIISDGINNHRVLGKTGASKWAFHNGLFKIGASEWAFQMLRSKVGASSGRFRLGASKRAFQVGILNWTSLN